jgi:hypothetical protein
MAHHPGSGSVTVATPLGSGFHCPRDVLIRWQFLWRLGIVPFDLDQYSGKRRLTADLNLENRAGSQTVRPREWDKLHVAIRR